MADTDILLEQHGLKKTAQRIGVLNVLADSKSAISHGDIEKRLGKGFDRVTIYRTLAAFEEKGLAHRVTAPDGTMMYAICTSNCTTHVHHDTHVHFSCTNCQKVYCLNEVETPALRLPKGFQVSAFSYMAEGICKACLASHQLKY